VALIGLAAAFATPTWGADPAGHAGQRPRTLGEIVTVPGERSPGFVDQETYAGRQRALHARLVAERVEGAERSPFTIFVTADELRAIAAREVGAETRKTLVGVARDVGGAVDFSGLDATSLPVRAQARRFGAFRGTPDGGFVWTGLATSPGASALRLHLTGFSLPPSTELYIYTDLGEAFGPYVDAGPNGDGDFWTNTVRGSSAYLQLRHRGATDADDLAGAGFVVAEIAHVDPVALAASGDATPLAGFCSFNAACVENKNCVSGEPGFVDGNLTYAVATIQFVSGGFVYICSGGLLADTDAATTIPYFLTANHCISKGREASSTEAYFQFTAPCGTSSCGEPSTSLRTVGASIKATNRTGDFTLLQLSQTPPAGSTYLGSTNAAIANSNGADLYRLSHPKGAPQAYSHHAVDTSKGTCSSWPRGSWIYSQDLEGATEGGSSGSVVVNAQGLVVGQLSGACGYNVNDVCDSESNATVDGALASYWSQVETFLAPSGGGGGGGGECLSTGSPCTSNDQCCSLSCKGKPGAKACK